MIKKLVTIAAAFCAMAAFAGVDINKATEAELDGVKGLGPATTTLILEQRKSGQFKNWNDVMSRVKGIGAARASRLSAEGLTVSGESFKPVVGATKPKADAEAKK